SQKSRKINLENSDFQVYKSPICNYFSEKFIISTIYRYYSKIKDILSSRSYKTYGRHISKPITRKIYCARNPNHSQGNSSNNQDKNVDNSPLIDKE
ncbi:MAG: hypothetical protein KUA33_02160, partial [Methanobacterium sp.]|nr:hypothetical protein [Euryarchaeota archaeon]MBV1729047.1 hypothetical protein [Methanobacterium sp.]